jgi:glycosyltransferase involved in cell wall biosynthesis
VLRQQSIEVEVIVVDDASTDDTPAMLAALGDARVRVVRHDKPEWLAAARNRGAAEARGEWMAFVDDDDLWAPDKLARQLDAARESGRDWVYAGAVNIEGERIVYSRPPLPPDRVVEALPRYNPIQGGGSNILVRRATWLRAGPFETRLRSGEDWEMSIRLAKLGPPAWVCRPLIAKRIHPSNMSLDTDEIVRAVRFIEGLHGTNADWARVRRWLAERHLRSGRRSAALVAFARAAATGQVCGVAADLSSLVRGSVERRFRIAPPNGVRGADTWAAAAAEWLRETDGWTH